MGFRTQQAHCSPDLLLPIEPDHGHIASYGSAALASDISTVAKLHHVSIGIIMSQETEGELFKRKSQWSEGYAAFMEFWSRVVSFFTLWKTSIQRVEGKHGKQIVTAQSAVLFFVPIPIPLSGTG